MRPSNKLLMKSLMSLCPGQNSSNTRMSRHDIRVHLIWGHDVPEDSCPPPPVTYSLFSALRRTDMTTCCVVITTVPHSARAFALPSPKNPTTTISRCPTYMISNIIIIFYYLNRKLVEIRVRAHGFSDRISMRA